jgi:hypothetical protein
LDVIPETSHARSTTKPTAINQQNILSPKIFTATGFGPVNMVGCTDADVFDKLPGLDRQITLKTMTSIVRIVLCAPQASRALHYIPFAEF